MNEVVAHTRGKGDLLGEGGGDGGGGRGPRTKLCSSEEKELLKELISKGIIQEVNG